MRWQSGLVFVPGGKSASGTPTNFNEIYDPRTNQWDTGSPLPRALSAYALIVYEGRMYLFGGWDGHRVVKDAYVYDPINDVWAQTLSMPTARSYAGSVVAGGKIYVVGGWDGQKPD
jgi:N-acetylneuraminic acid mutarotase